MRLHVVAFVIVLLVVAGLWWARVALPILAIVALGGLLVAGVLWAGRGGSTKTVPPASARGHAMIAAFSGLAVTAVLFIVGSNLSNIVAEFAILFSIMATLLLTAVVTAFLLARGRAART